MTKKAQKWLIEYPWLVFCTASLFFGIGKFFVPLDFVSIDKISGSILALLSALGIGMYKSFVRLELQLSERLSIVDKVAKLSEEDRACIIRIAGYLDALSYNIEKADNSVRDIIYNGLRESEISINSLSMGRISAPISESPSVNHTIIERFGRRMDAVSFRDLDFWGSHLGRQYLEKCCEPTGTRTGRPKLTRIFIIDVTEISDPTVLDKIVSILVHHLEREIGFAVVFTDAIRPIKQEFGISEDNENGDDSPRLDFALFSFDKAVTFFRGQNSQRRIKAFLNLGHEHSANEKLIASQRRVWIRLIAEAWLVSDDFVKLVRDEGLSEDEANWIHKHTTGELDRLTERTRHKPEDKWSPLLVTEPIEIRPKLLRSKELHREFHQRKVSR